MKQSFYQGWLDSLCGVYSIINSDRIINRTSEDGSQKLFNEIISYLSKKRKLKEILIGGVYHINMVNIMTDVVGDRFTWKIMGADFYNISDWWGRSRHFLGSQENSAIILSVGGLDNHISVIHSMTDRVMRLADSSTMTSLRKSLCRLSTYQKEDKFVIYPTQSFWCWKE